VDVHYAKVALKALQGYDKPTRNRIREKIIQGLTKSPPEGDIKPIVGEEEVFRLRVGKYRIKFEYFMEEVIKEDGSTQQEKALRVIDIDSRGDIYK
jgi:mRNA-degrading endonuclease RelE of RelBE toxin-antitoxin system